MHNIDGRMSEIFRKEITEADPALVLETLRNSTYSAFLVGQKAAGAMLAESPDAGGHRGTILFTNASAAFKGYPRSGAFAMACHGKSGLAQSMARELGPKNIHVAHFVIDGAIAREGREGGGQPDDLLSADAIAETYLHVHRQHRSAWSDEVALRPWVETF